MTAYESNGPALKQRRIDAGIEFHAFCDTADLNPKKVQMIEDGDQPLSELFEEVYLFYLERQTKDKGDYLWHPQA